MAFHIVTNRCFLSCHKISYVLLQPIRGEEEPYNRKNKKKGSKTKNEPEYEISIRYAIDSNMNDENLSFVVVGAKEAQMAYAAIIKEIQEQYPNEVYLDKLVNDLLKEEVIAIGPTP